MKKHNYSKYFKSKKRDSGESFFSLDDSVLADQDTVKKLKRLVHAVHVDLFNGTFPNDWIYERVMYALERLECLETDEQYERASCEVEPDCYTDLIDWSGYGFFREYVDEELQEGGKFESLHALLGMAQVRAIERIYPYVWDFLCKEREGE